MKKEFEVVSQETFRYLHVFLVNLASRTPHIHKEIELGLVLKGKLTVREGKNAWSLDRDEMYLINSMEAHEFVADDPDTLILAIQISPKMLTPFLSDAALLRFRTEPPVHGFFREKQNVWQSLRNDCIELARYYHARPDGFEFDCFHLISHIVLLLRRYIPVDSLSQKDYNTVRRRMDRIAAITDYIDQNYQRKLLLEEIAEMNNLTLTHVSHLFKDTLGITFQDYLKEKRFEHALSLFENTDGTILEITVESGFSDERYLTKLFHARMSCSPKEYRKKQSQAQNRPRNAVMNTQKIYNDEEAIAFLGNPGYCSSAGIFPSIHS